MFACRCCCLLFRYGLRLFFFFVCSPFVPPCGCFFLSSPLLRFLSFPLLPSSLPSFCCLWFFFSVVLTRAGCGFRSIVPPSVSLSSPFCVCGCLSTSAAGFAPRASPPNSSPLPLFGLPPHPSACSIVVFVVITKSSSTSVSWRVTTTTTLTIRTTTTTTTITTMW